MHLRMEIAEPRSIVMTRNTHKLARDFFEFGSLGKIEAKDKEEPQDAFERVKVSKGATRIGASVAKGLSRFVGRKNSIAALTEAREKSLSDEGQVVGIIEERGLANPGCCLEGNAA